MKITYKLCFSHFTDEGKEIWVKMIESDDLTYVMVKLNELRSTNPKHSYGLFEVQTTETMLTT